MNTVQEQNIDVEQLKKSGNLPRSLTFFLNILEDYNEYGIEDNIRQEADSDGIEDNSEDVNREIVDAFALLEELEEMYPGKMIEVCEGVVRQSMHLMNIDQWLYGVYVLGVEIQDRMLYNC